MDKKTMMKVAIIMVAAMTLALLIRGIIVQHKSAEDAQISDGEMPFAETEWEEKPYSGCIVVVDAGHGGKDPGKVGVNGTLEKDINLEIALLLKDALEEQGITVVMTRQNDSGLYDENSSNKKMQDLRGRLAIMEESRADLVVSIHQNSFGDPSVCGPQVFYYETSESGEQAAEMMQNALNEELGIARPRVHKGNDNYYLLTKSSLVMVIAECGFLSNPEEEAFLKDKDYQKQMVAAIQRGICEYLDSVKADKENKTEDENPKPESFLYEEESWQTEPVI